MSTRSLPFAGPTVLCSGSGIKEEAGMRSWSTILFVKLGTDVKGLRGEATAWRNQQESRIRKPVAD
jgi:hypothetical protein